MDLIIIHLHTVDTTKDKETGVHKSLSVLLKYTNIEAADKVLKPSNDEGLARMLSVRIKKINGKVKATAVTATSYNH